LTSDSSASDAGTSTGLVSRYYNDVGVTLTGFGTIPMVFICVNTGWHDVRGSCVGNVSTTSANIVMSCSREAGVQNKTVTYLAIGEAS